MFSPRFSCVSSCVRRVTSPFISRTAVSSIVVYNSKPTALDVAALLAAQQIARAAQFQVERGDLEARAQVAELLQRRQPSPRQVGQLAIGGNQQIRIRAAIGAPHASAQLVQLATARGGRRD